MNQKDYNEIAKILNGFSKGSGEHIKNVISVLLADYFMIDSDGFRNHKFNKKQFLLDCGVD